MRSAFRIMERKVKSTRRSNIKKHFHSIWSEESSMWSKKKNIFRDRMKETEIDFVMEKHAEKSLNHQAWVARFSKAKSRDWKSRFKAATGNTYVWDKMNFVCRYSVQICQHNHSKESKRDEKQRFSIFSDLTFSRPALSPCKLVFDLWQEP